MASSRPRLRAVPSPPSAEPPPWSSDTGVDAVIQKWLARRAVVECLAAERTLGSRGPSYAPLPEGLDPRLVQGLARRGITQLYDHQAQAIQAALAGRHVVIATPTASGKSLCLHLPVLNAIARDPEANALYLYPTKALSRDQEQGLHALIADAELGIPALVYDGDTPGDARRAARQQSRVLMTNPDILHASLLPQHTRWARVFQRLEYVVIDELHSYRGVFGSHLAHVITRLLRIAEFHGSRPRFILASATIGNPREHAARLLGLAPDQLELVSSSGAPAAERRLFLYNPPVVNAELGIRGSSLKHAVRLALDLLEARVSTILFAGSRNSVEVMLKYIRDQSGVPADAVFGYRGGYLPEKRRAIERGLREGSIRCVVATNALELGIDIGDLDAVICVGYPGSVAATWQRFGRAGRRGDKSIGVLVLNSQATDQFLAGQPEYVLEAGAEEARIDPENVEILLQHLKCAAFELPFAKAEGVRYSALDEPGTRDALEYLSRQGLLYSGETGYTWTGDGSPATYVSLRSISWDNFVIIELDQSGFPAAEGGADELAGAPRSPGRTLAELDWRSAHTMLHEQAIYQHDAAQYQVERLDYENHKAYVRRVEPDYFTTALTNSRVTILDPAAEREVAQGKLQHGDVEVIETITGYKKIKFVTHENAGYGDVRLPDLQMHTTAFWWTLHNHTSPGSHAPPGSGPGPRGYLDRWAAPAGTLRGPSSLLIDALRGAGAALETVASIALMCEPRDIGRTLGSRDGASDREGYQPTLFLFDALPGGVGLARRIFERAEELFSRATRLIAGCPCKSGCPACIGAAILSEPQASATPATYTASARKAAALALLEGF